MKDKIVNVFTWLWIILWLIAPVIIAVNHYRFNRVISAGKELNISYQKKLIAIDSLIDELEELAGVE